ncbi:DUF4282 domain-containing protein [Propionibacterium australiense]|uniref:DUF4282 domain-containing protein n=1 Tax=Propionibacterium australiense TaxID=119981 RepID=A0A8B3FQ74_9ACTN|nr:DUF4282 domain-containing protein [Propionibacterium australiense]RLP08783.1 DUF4282 domain-containing protein [Propionibacterium australiense]
MQQPWGQNQNQQPGQAPQATPYAQQMPYAAAPQAPAPQASEPVPGQKDGLRALFDFGFTSMATPLLVKIIYIIVMVLAALSWLSAIISSIWIASLIDSIGSIGSSGYGRSSSGGSGAWAVVMPVLFGWIPGALMILITRVLCEFVLASLKTQRAAEEILARLRSE